MGTTVNRRFKVSAYVSQARSFATDYTPNTVKATQVVLTVKQASDDGETATVAILVGGVQVTSNLNDFAVSGLLGITGHSYLDKSVTFIVPPNTTYRFNSSGTGVNTIVSTYEMTLG